MKYMENVHYLHDLKDVEEALANPKAHWDDLEDRKARLQWGGHLVTRAEHVGRVRGRIRAWEC